MRMFTTFALALAITACGRGGGPVGSSDFVKACVSSRNMDRGVCECAFEKAQEHLSPEAMDFLVTSMGKNQERAHKLRQKLSAKEIMQSGMFMLNVYGQCAKELSGR